MKAMYVFFGALFIFVFALSHFSNKAALSAQSECEAKNGVLFTSRNGSICIAKEAVR